MYPDHILNFWKGLTPNNPDKGHFMRCVLTFFCYTEMYLSLGAPAKLRCLAYGHPKPSVTW